MVEKKPIIKVAFWKYKEAWHRLPAEERNEIADKLLVKMKDLAIKVLVYSNCYWACEEWMYLNVEEHINIESVQKLEDYLIEIGWQRYVESKLYLSTRATAEDWMKSIMRNP